MDNKLENVCRLCMSVDIALEPIFSESSNVCSRIKEIFPKLEISVGDGLPDQVCVECLQQLNISYNFKLQCEQSDAVFRHYLDIKAQNVLPNTNTENGAQQKDENDVEDNLDMCVTNDTDEPNSSCEEEVKTDENDSSVKCDLCSEQFNSKQSLEQHNCATQFTCQICGKVLKTSVSLSRHLAQHKNNKPPITCNLCGKRFSFHKTYLGHMRVHHDLGYKCKDCNKVFPTPYTLKTHRRKHTGEKPYICEVCGKTFSLNQGYKNHKKIHTGVRPFQCPSCPKSFMFKIHLQNHINIHTGEKPYVCELCGRKFSDQSGLAHHMKARHTEKKSIYKCSICPKSYFHSENLKTHIRTHTGERPYKCVTCGRSFTIKSLLTNHQRVHTGEKRYDCNFCNKRFSTSSSRDRHVRTHTGEKPYECTVCLKAFSLKRDLKNHTDRCHPVKPVQ